VSKRWGKARSEESESTEHPTMDIPAVVLPVACGGENCRARTRYIFPGEGPYTVGMFENPEWVVLAGPELAGTLFVCPNCIDQFLKEDEQLPKVSG
jgi:hypothetical protein